MSELFLLFLCLLSLSINRRTMTRNPFPFLIKGHMLLCLSPMYVFFSFLYSLSPSQTITIKIQCIWTKTNPDTCTFDAYFGIEIVCVWILKKTTVKIYVDVEATIPSFTSAARLQFLTMFPNMCLVLVGCPQCSSFCILFLFYIEVNL